MTVRREKRGSRPLRWLHLSDLHLGCPGQGLWWQIETSFEHSVRAQVRQLGAPDLLLLSGDLAYSGKADQYARVEQLLAALFSWLHEETGSPAPIPLAVPGNHDLERPQKLDEPRYQVLADYALDQDNEYVRELRQQLWVQRDPSFLKPLFANYLEFWARTIRPRLEARARHLQESHFPGDFYAELTFEDSFPLLVVGLNSTWPQFNGSNFERRLKIPGQQFQALLADAVPRQLFARQEHALLLLHHPPDWLSAAGRATFFSEIAPPERFALCLFGHLHEASSTGISTAGGSFRYFFQSPSLFGLENYGRPDERRQIGYSWGTLSAEGVVRVWPLKHVVRGSGAAVFVPDAQFTTVADGSFQLRPWTVTTPELPQQLDLTAYLTAVLADTDYLEISGIAASQGSIRGALRPPIEQLYTALKCRALPRTAHSDADPDGWRHVSGELVGLATLLPQSKRLLFVGQPGAGKTTFLRFVAAMLARDHLKVPCPEGPSWRQRYLGLGPHEPARVPLLLKLADLEQLLVRAEQPRRDDCSFLLDLLVKLWDAKRYGVGRDDWQQLLTTDRGILLLDGLDEVADEGLRQRLLQVFRDACTHWSCPIVVTSRPISTQPLVDLGFQPATVEPLSPAEIRAFIDRWVAALQDVAEVAELGSASASYREALQQAITGNSGVRRMANNPVLLTCLCVVHWNEGKRLPEGRAQVFSAALRWLLAARSPQRRTRFGERAADALSDDFALRALAALALAMLASAGGKQTRTDLEAAVDAVVPELAREFPQLDALSLRHRARAWLEFECLGSGVIVQVAGNRIAFWHLNFQEYLAALQLAWFSDGDCDEVGDRGAKAWWPQVLPRLEDLQWRETIELFPACLLAGGRGRIDLLLDRALALRGSKPDLADDARVVGVLGRWLPSLAVYGYKPPADWAQTYEEVRQQTLQIFELGGAHLPFALRLSAAEALGRGGDPRFAAGERHLLPVSDLGIKLGKYPVTVEEYQRFVDQGGYEQADTWSPAGLELKEKEGWSLPEGWDEQLATPNRPVVGVSFYEAEAYCRWLCEQWEVEVRLPTEREWETAATPARGDYPWGDAEPDASLANFGPDFKPNVGAPTPVGLYPKGDGPYGHSDLAGNVWEWCSDPQEVPWAKDEEGRGVRGGGWSDPAEFLRAAYRNWSWARYRRSVLGFRLVVAPSSR